ncbi:MAG TPA: DUF4139 domain-containing protein [Candidatus Omnitrophota bacterium]|nr:DUF4139 domain-containing protein [Candidatus Omnitrophota bacterium]
MSRHLLPLAVVLMPLLAQAQTVSTPADRLGLQLTVTQGDLATVRDRRSISLDKGALDLTIEGVAREARIGTATLVAPGVSVREQGFVADTLAADTLLARSLGREVAVVWRDGDKEERAKVLAAGPVPVFQIGNRVVAGQPARLLFDALPTGLGALPSWRAAIASEAAGKREAELTYLTGGLSWQADYAAELGDDKLTLSAWATIMNQSGADYPAAQLRVVAGNANQAPGLRRDAKVMMAAMAEPAREAAGIHHLYTIPQPVTLLAGESRQVALLPPAQVAVEKVLVLDPQPPHVWRSPWGEPDVRHPQQQLRFRNNLGKPLPAGIVRVMAQGVLQGEDRLAATPDGAPARLTLGEALDLTARRSQTDFQRVAPEISEAAWEVRLANGGDKPAKVQVREAFGGEWLVIDESDKHLRDGAQGAAWTVSVPAKGETVLKYRVRVKG